MIIYKGRQWVVGLYDAQTDTHKLIPCKLRKPKVYLISALKALKLLASR